MSSTAANGGGIYLDSGTATLDEVTVYDNAASSNGGGMYVANGATANLTLVSGKSEWTFGEIVAK